jgi:hypothetical protein
LSVLPGWLRQQFGKQGFHFAGIGGLGQMAIEAGGDRLLLVLVSSFGPGHR